MFGRRRVLVGGGALLLALAGLGYRAWDRGVGAEGEGTAYAPWRNWQGGPQDGRLRPLRAAILAANPHDTQPWVFAPGQDAIEVFADRSRNLGSFDPFRREMHLGLGAAIENFVARRPRLWNGRCGRAGARPARARAGRCALPGCAGHPHPESRRYAPISSTPSQRAIPIAAPTCRIERSRRTGSAASPILRKATDFAWSLSPKTPPGAMSAR